MITRVFIDALKSLSLNNSLTLFPSFHCFHCDHSADLHRSPANSIEYSPPLSSPNTTTRTQSLRKEVIALTIMKSNYEQIVKSVHQQNQPGHQTNQISEELKFQVFQSICDSLFQSFDSSVKAQDFNEITACIFGWLEENCKPSILRNVTVDILKQAKRQQN